jgi:hypothetical protein
MWLSKGISEQLWFLINPSVLAISNHPTHLTYLINTDVNPTQ